MIVLQIRKQRKHELESIKTNTNMVFSTNLLILLVSSTLSLSLQQVTMCSLVLRFPSYIVLPYTATPLHLLDNLSYK